MKKILVVEDDQFLANAYRIKLEKEKFDVRVAMDGEEALTVVGEFMPDLILLDLVMPKVDGFAVLQSLKSKDVTKGIKVIVASNLGQTEDIDRAVKLGADGYIIKSDMSIADIVKMLE